MAALQGANAAAGGGGGGGGSFLEPTNEPSLLIWYAGWKTTGTNTGEEVTSVSDWSGHNFHGTKGAGSAPIFTNNAFGTGLHGYRFNGGKSWDIPLVFSGVTEADVFVALMIDADPPAGNVNLWALGSAAANQFYPFTDGVIYEDFGTVTRKTTANPSASLANLHIYNVTAAAAWTNRVNGTVIYGDTGNIPAFLNISGASIGANSGGTYVGYIAEFIYCSNKLAFASRSNIMAYLTNKYSVGSVVIQ